MNFLALITGTITQPPAAGEVATQAVNAATNAAGATGAAGGGFMGIVSFILYMVFIVGVMWVLVIRPQKKREKKLKETITNIRPGDSILTNAGFYGKVVDVTEGCFVVEFGTNRGIRIPVEKSEVAGIKEPNLTVKRYDTPAIADEEDNK